MREQGNGGRGGVSPPCYGNREVVQEGESGKANEQPQVLSVPLPITDKLRYKQDACVAYEAIICP